MSKIWKCLRLEFVLDNRKRISPIVPVLTALISSVIFIVMVPDDRGFGDSVARSSWATEIFIILGVISGFIHQNREQPEIKELMISANIYRIKKVGKALWSLIESLVLFFIVAVICVIGLGSLHTPKVLVVSSIKYLALYWILPYIVACISSMVVIDRFAGKIKYLFLVILIIFLGPLVPVIASPLVNMNTFLFKYFCIFNLGPLNTSKPINVMFGYDLQPSKIVSGFLLLLSFVIIYMIDPDDRSKRKIALFSAFLICFALSVSVNYRYIIGKLDYEVATRMERAYDNEIEMADKGKGKYTRYDIESMHIAIKNRQNMSYTVDMEIVPVKNLSAIDFVLYHDFIISDLTADGKKTEYKISGDVIRIKGNFKKEKNIHIKINYSGKPAIHMYSDTDEWLLPSYLAWYPKRGDKDNIVYTDDLYELNYTEYKSDEMNTSVRYSGSGKIYCNLNQNGKYRWGGKTNGITMLCSDWMQEKKLENSTSVIYPKLAEGYSYTVSGYKKRLEKILKILDKKDEYPNSMNKLFITCDSTYTGHGEKVNLYSDHCIVEITRGYITGDDLENKSIIAGISTYPMEQEIFLNDIPENDFTFLFKTAVTTELIKEGAFVRTDLVESLDDLGATYNGVEGYKNYSILTSEIKKYIENNDTRSVWRFIEGYAEELVSGRCSVGRVQALMED